MESGQSNTKGPSPSTTLKDKPSHKRFRRRGATGFPSLTGRDHGRSGEGVRKEKFRLEDLEVDVAKICGNLNSHQHFKVKEGYVMKNLPKFDDLTRYKDVTEDQEMELWAFEVRRLAAAVKSPDPPVLEGSPEWYGGVDDDGYNRLHMIALAIKSALLVCRHDNELLLLQHHPALVNVESFHKSFERLLYIFDPEERTVRYDRNLRLDKHHDEVYHAIVNYTTAILARTLLRTMKGDFWVNNCLESIAKYAAKMKVVGADLPEAVAATNDAWKDYERSMIHSARTPTMVRILAAQKPRHSTHTRSHAGAQTTAASQGSDDTEEQDGDITVEVNSGSIYFIIMDAFRDNIRRLLLSILDNLAWNEQKSQTADIFETSSIIYDTGFENLRTQLCQERDGAIGVAVESDVIQCASLAFNICREVWTSLPSTNSRPGHCTWLNWTCTELCEQGNQGECPSEQRSLTEMKDVVKALVPYQIFCGVLPSIISLFANTVFLLSDPGKPTQYYAQPNLLATARMRTSQYIQSRDAAGDDSSHFQPVYETPMAQELAFARDSKERGASSTNYLDAAGGVRYKDFTREVGNAEKLLREWTIDDRAIIVPTFWYTWTVLAGVGLLTAGGVAMVSLEDRIAGVDPANLTVLVWTAAGVLMIYLKSLRVENWPWRDFFFGRVVCRSVSEVKAVTGVDPQVLMALLLRHETRMYLEKRRPFHALFSRRHDDGFAIDVPPRTATVIAGGLIFIRVNSVTGPALVALSARRWDTYDAVSHKSKVERDTNYICRDFSEPWSFPLKLNGADRVPLPLYPICNNSLRWHLVEGVFVQNAVFG